MPSYDQLDNEAAWRDEFTPPALARLSSGLKAHWPGAGVWVRGDNEHLRGYHRSRRWIKESDYCTSRTYSVSRTVGDRSGGDSNWCCALDLGNIAQSELHAACKRLDAAVRAGRLEKVTEWYGNFGNDLRVDGYDNISNQMASADSSHLYHLHMSFDRGRANEDHSDVLAVLTGASDVNPTDVKEIWNNYEAVNGRNMRDNVGETWQAAHKAMALAEQANAKLDALADLELTDEQLDRLADKVAAKMPVPPTAEEIADELAARLAA